MYFGEWDVIARFSLSENHSMYTELYTIISTVILTVLLKVLTAKYNALAFTLTTF